MVLGWRSGQSHLTVNQAPYGLRGFESLSQHHFRYWSIASRRKVGTPYGLRGFESLSQHHFRYWSIASRRKVGTPYGLRRFESCPAHQPYRLEPYSNFRGKKKL